MKALAFDRPLGLDAGNRPILITAGESGPEVSGPRENQWHRMAAFIVRQMGLAAGEEMKTYVFKVMIEPDGDGWRAYFPAWEHVGASTWGFTQKEALKNMQEVLQLVLEDLVEENDPIPEVSEGEGFISAVPQVAVTI